MNTTNFARIYKLYRMGINTPPKFQNGFDFLECLFKKLTLVDGKYYVDFSTNMVYMTLHLNSDGCSILVLTCRGSFFSDNLRIFGLNRTEEYELFECVVSKVLNIKCHLIGKYNNYFDDIQEKLETDGLLKK